GLPRAAVGLAGPAQHAPALALEEDLALFVGFGAHRAALGVEGAGVPLAVPGLFLDDGQHLIVAVLPALGVGGLALGVVERHHLLAGVQEEARDHHALGLAAVHVAGQLEALVGLLAEAVQVQAVVPVGVTDQRQAVGPAHLHRV